MSEKIPYEFSENLVLRTPVLPFPSTISEEILNNLFNDKLFDEAIYLASPVLYQQYIKWKNGTIKSEKEIQKLKLSLVKYYQRMSSRCTPFGLFSGCSVVNWSDENTKIFFKKEDHKRHTRPDMHFLSALAQCLSVLPALKNKMLFYPNNSLYIIGDEIRYVEYKYQNRHRTYQISSVATTEYLVYLLEKAANGIRLTEAIILLGQYNVTTEEANEFVDDLINSQILISELEPSITGNEFTYQLFETIKKYLPADHNGVTDECPDLNEIFKVLERIISFITKLDETQECGIDVYKEIINLIKSLNVYLNEKQVEYDESRLFQVDLFKATHHASVNKMIQQQILSALAVLNKLSPQSGNESIKSFTKRFTERYDDALVSLSEVLDSETGIGYPEGTSKDISPLTDDLVLPSDTDAKDQLLQWNTTQQWLFERLKKATVENKYTICLTEEDVRAIDSSQSGFNWADLPPSLSVMFRITNAAESQIMIESAGGSSAANLLGRFAHGDVAIYNIVNEITSKEQQLNPEIIFAEIVHLPEDRAGNVLLHPAFREYEIPYLAKSSLKNEKQIPLNDLWITVENNQVKLFSKKLNKQIIPRLSTAHNFNNNALPVYKFLCDLQSQQQRHRFAFHWGILSGQFNFFPRVEYNKTILHEATWYLKKNEIEEITGPIEKEDIESLKNIIIRWRLPRYFVLADHDHELLIDAESKLSLQAFGRTVKNRFFIYLKEFIFDSSATISDEKSGFFTNQFIASLIKTEKVYTSLSIARNKVAEDINRLRRKFEPGSEWLYYKIYCGVQSAEKILESLIGPLTKKLLNEKIITKWFYVRYSDPSFHLRIRFHLNNADMTGKVINLISEMTIDSGLGKFIWNTKIDTYEREIERYSPDYIELAEDLFYHDSLNKMKFIEITDDGERGNIRWLWGLRMVDELLNAFEYTLVEKQSLLAGMKENFGKEFNADKKLFFQLNKKYNSNKQAIKKIMTSTLTNCDSDYSSLMTEADQYYTDIKAIVQKMKKVTGKSKTKDHFKEAISSYIHMSLNRLFPTEARLQEYILYEFLNRWFLSILKQNFVSISPGLI